MSVHYYVLMHKIKLTIASALVMTADEQIIENNKKWKALDEIFLGLWVVSECWTCLAVINQY